MEQILGRYLLPAESVHHRFQRRAVGLWSLAEPLFFQLGQDEGIDRRADQTGVWIRDRGDGHGANWLQ